MTYPFNEGNADITVYPDTWESSNDVLFLHRQLAILENRLMIIKSSSDFSTMGTSVIQHQIERLNLLIDKLYQRKWTENNQFI